MNIHRTHSEMFKVLGVESRIKIIELLKTKGPLGVKTIAEEVGLTPAAVSQHLKVLRHAGFVSKERQGYWIPYSIDEEALESCGGKLMEVCACGCRPTEKTRTQGAHRANLESLIKQKKDLEKELEDIQKEISAIKKKTNS